MLDLSEQWYFAPGDDTLQAFLTFMGTAQRKIRLADYSFNMEQLVQLLIQKKNAGVDVMLVLDKTQAAGPSEVPIIQQIKQAGVPVMIGTSSLHKIMHSKYTVIDDEWIQGGSWNYTLTATKESNFFFIKHDPDVASIFLKDWQVTWDWINAHVPQT